LPAVEVLAVEERLPLLRSEGEGGERQEEFHASTVYAC
jgi:hypothetical protein